MFPELFVHIYFAGVRSGRPIKIHGILITKTKTVAHPASRLTQVRKYFNNVYDFYTLHPYDVQSASLSTNVLVNT